MKKILVPVFAVCVTMGSLCAQSIKIMAPMATGQDLPAGSSYPIRWQATGLKNPVKITLWRNGLQMGVILKELKVVEGISSYNWPVGNLEIGGQAPVAKGYWIKVKEIGKPVAGKSLPFDIVPAKNPQIGIIQVEAFRPPPHRHRAPALTIPERASFTIKEITGVFSANGKLEKVSAVIQYQSKTPFTFRPDQGNPQDGPLYANCKISNALWPADKQYSFKPAAKGPVYPDIVYNHRLSTKYGGQQHLEFSPKVMNPGSGEFIISFKPACSKNPKTLHTTISMNSGAFSSLQFCDNYYSPKIELRLFVHAKEGVKSSYMKAYLVNAPRHAIKPPGKVNFCSSGQKYW